MKPANTSAPPVVGMLVVWMLSFERDGNAVQRAANLALRALAIERIGLVERLRIDRQRRVEAVLVHRDADQILLDQLPRGELLPAPSPPASAGSSLRRP
jgi:hypothetical protein